MHALFRLIAVVAAAGAVSVMGAGSHSSADDEGVVDHAAAPADVAQGDADTNEDPDTDRRLIDRSSTERVDSVVVALFSIAAAMTVMLAVFLWHTSPRRRLRLARRRSSRLHAGADPAPEPDSAEVPGRSSA